MTSATAGNHLRPTPPEQRSATGWEIAGLWVSLVVGVPSYYIAGSLVEQGMSWWQGLAVVVSAKSILLVPLLLAAEPGARYGLPFPVLARAAFGVRGAHVPSLLRALVACGWFGIESWIGGQAIALLLPPALRVGSLAVPLPWLGTSPLDFACFSVFWFAQLALVWKGMYGIRQLEKYSAPLLVLLAAGLLTWAVTKAGGFGEMLSLPSRLTSSEFWALFFPSLTANVGSWAAFALTISDFTRYSRSQTDQVLGQLGLPLFAGAFAFVGLAVTSTTAAVLGRVISNPVDLLAEIGGAAALLLAVPGLLLAIVTTNIPANVVSPANALVGLSPKLFGFRSAAATTAFAAVMFQPWRIFRSPDSFMYTWLVGYSAMMGPLAGVLLTDYYVVRRRELDVDALYDGGAGSVYYYAGGFNPAAIAAVAASLAPVLPGFLHKLGVLGPIPRGLVFVYNVGWFFGFFTAAVVYWALSKLWKWWSGFNIVKGHRNRLCSCTSSSPELKKSSFFLGFSIVANHFPHCCRTKEFVAPSNLTVPLV